jgi:membrane-bound metal-dependent hydrolase YbcI (DUF457 family)
MNAAVHYWTAALAAGMVLHADERTRGQVTPWPIAGTGLAAVATNLPDILEPAVTPHHRQFFHSLAFAGLLIAAGKALYDWQPETDEGRFWRKAGLIGLGAYLCHLALDATTPRSLPLLGR